MSCYYVMKIVLDLFYLKLIYYTSNSTILWKRNYLYLKICDEVKKNIVTFFDKLNVESVTYCLHSILVDMFFAFIIEKFCFDNVVFRICIQYRNPDPEML